MFRKAAQLKPGQAETHYRLARALKRAGHHTEAESEFEKLKQIRAASQQRAADALDEIRKRATPE